MVHIDARENIVPSLNSGSFTPTPSKLCPLVRRAWLTSRTIEVDNYAITEFVQGQTRRWAIAWSFGTLRLPDVRTYLNSLNYL